MAFRGSGFLRFEVRGSGFHVGGIEVRGFKLRVRGFRLGFGVPGTGVGFSGFLSFGVRGFVLGVSRFGFQVAGKGFPLWGF